MKLVVAYLLISLSVHKPAINTARRVHQSRWARRGLPVAYFTTYDTPCGHPLSWTKPKIHKPNTLLCVSI